jgi:Ca-activated chloride channel family protein
MLSPVILALKESKAQALVWAGNASVTWQDIASAAAQDKLALAITNPASSNSGFAAITGLAAALAGTGEALTVADIKAERLAGFYRAQKLTSGSSGWLAEAYEREQDRLDGIVNYESVVLSMNASGKLHEKLVPVYPREGIITADYPFMLLDESKRAAYDKVVAHLRTKAFQEALMKATLRRPVNPDVALDAAFPKGLLVELPFPGSVEVIDTLLAKFLSDIRVPATAYYVLDTSGSMAGGNPSRMELLKQSMFGLLGDDRSTSGRFARFQPRERIELLRFSTQADPVRSFEIGADPATNRATLDKLRAAVQGLTPNGGTALYEAVRNAYRDAAKVRGAKNGRYVTIVVLTDGENNGSLRLEDFRAFHEGLPAAERGIKVFPVLFGEAKAEEMEELARITGGRTFDARKTALAAVLKDIRGYQ